MPFKNASRPQVYEGKSEFAASVCFVYTTIHFERGTTPLRRVGAGRALLAPPVVSVNSGRRLQRHLPSLSEKGCLAFERAGISAALSSAVNGER